MSLSDCPHCGQGGYGYKRGDRYPSQSSQLQDGVQIPGFILFLT
jgi:hypothetical protein